MCTGRLIHLTKKTLHRPVWRTVLLILEREGADVLLDCHNIPSGTTFDADVCIVGAGPAGVTLAQELIGRGLRIVMLERGGPPGAPLGLLPGVPVTQCSDFDSPPATPPRFGGGANEWIVRLPWSRRGVRVVGMSPIDLATRDWVADSGWPIPWPELERYYRRAHVRLGIGDWQSDVGAWESPEAPRLPLEEFGFTTAIERFARPEIFTVEAWRTFRRSDDVMVLLNAPAGSVHAEADRVDRVEIDAGAPGRLTVRPRVAVLAAGGLENARLLLGANDCGGLGNAHDVVGRYYMDHLRFVSGQLRPFEARLFRSAGLYDLRSVRDAWVSAKLVPSEELLRREELLNSAAMLLPKPSLAVQEAFDEIRTAARALRARSLPEHWPTVDAVRRASAHVGLLGPELALRQRRLRPKTDAGWSGVWRSELRYATFAVEHQIEQAPDRTNRAFIGNERDAFGRPLLELDWRWTELDLRSAQVAPRLLAAAFEAAGVGTFSVTPWSEHPPLTTPGGAFHSMGTTRMHVEQRRGVVDEHARVHGVRNLFVAGNSVFPTGGFANPTFTLVALSIRLADHLARTLAEQGAMD